MASIASADIEKSTSAPQESGAQLSRSELLLSNSLLNVQNKKRKTSEDDEQIIYPKIIQENHRLRAEVDKLKEKLRETLPKKNKRIVSSVFTLNDEIEGVKTWSLKRLASINTVEELDKQAEANRDESIRLRPMSPSTTHLVEKIISE